jgi:hypothetical protein
MDIVRQRDGLTKHQDLGEGHPQLPAQTEAANRAWAVALAHDALADWHAAMTTQAILDAINAYADAQARAVNDRDWLALTHRSSRGPDADRARALRDAGREALDVIQDWPEVEVRPNGARLLEAPDGTRVLYYCERRHGRTFERLGAFDPDLDQRGCEP